MGASITPENLTVRYAKRPTSTEPHYHRAICRNSRERMPRGRSDAYLEFAADIMALSMAEGDRDGKVRFQGGNENSACYVLRLTKLGSTKKACSKFTQIADLGVRAQVSDTILSSAVAEGFDHAVKMIDWRGSMMELDSRNEHAAPASWPRGAKTYDRRPSGSRN